MTTKIDVINVALQMLGVDETSNLDPANKFLIAAANQYENIVQSNIANLDWRFATRFEQLSQLVERPETSYFEYFYEVPADFLAVVRLEPNTVDYEFYSKGRILSNATTLKMEYRYRVAEEFWPLYFADFISASLASRLAITTVRNMEIAKELKIVAQEAFAKASFSDNQNRPNSQLWYVPTIQARW